MSDVGDWTLTQVEIMLRATLRDETRRMTQMIAAVRVGAWGSADDVARINAAQTKP